MTKEILEKTIDFDDAINRIVILEKENAELKCECRRCIYTDCPCILSDYGKDRNGICDHFKDVFDENTELRTKLEALEGQTPWKDIENKSKLIKENAELKARLNAINLLTSELRKASKLRGQQLTKAKEIMKEMLSVLPKENIEDIYRLLKNQKPS